MDLFNLEKIKQRYDSNRPVIVFCFYSNTTEEQSIVQTAQ